jgi:putative transposase
MDFLSDQLFDGTPIRVLTIVDAHSRVSPAVDVRPSHRGADAAETLERVAGRYGLPRPIRLGNGPEFISLDLDLWACARRRQPQRISQRSRWWGAEGGVAYATSSAWR